MVEAQSSEAPGPKQNGYLSQNEDGSWTVVAVVQEAVSDNGTPTYTVTPNEMETFAATMIGGAVHYEHEKDGQTIGIIDDAWSCDLAANEKGEIVHSGTPQRILASIRIFPKTPVGKVVLQQIQSGNMKGVSLGMEASFATRPDGVTERILQFQELSMVFEGDISGSRLLEVVDPDTGLAVPGLDAIPQSVQVTASGRKPSSIRTKCWLPEKKTSDAKRVLVGRLTFSLKASASSSNPPTLIMSSTSTQKTNSSPDSGSDMKTEAPSPEQLLKQLNEAVALQKAAEAALKQKMDEETTRKFWEKNGQSLKALYESLSVDGDSEQATLLEKALQDNTIVLDPAIAGMLAGMATGYSSAAAAIQKRPREPEDVVGPAATDVAASDKRVRLSDAERLLRQQIAGKAAANSSKGQDFKQQWANRVADPNGKYVFSPEDGSLNKMNSTPNAPSTGFDIDYLLEAFADPAGFTLGQNVQQVTASIKNNPEKCVEEAAKRAAIDYYTRGGRKVDHGRLVGGNDTQNLTLCASRGMV
ncbi:MAG: hypothetical protein AB7P49_00705 [Bdellovibrionales bacterium]